MCEICIAWLLWKKGKEISKYMNNMREVPEAVYM